RSMQIEFLKPARMDDVLTVVTAPEEVKGASITLNQRILRGDDRSSRRMCASPLFARDGRGQFPKRCVRQCARMRTASAVDLPRARLISPSSWASFRDPQGVTWRRTGGRPGPVTGH